MSFSSSFFPSLFFSGGRGDGVGIKSCETILLPRKQLHCAHDCRLNGYSVCLFFIIKKKQLKLNFTYDEIEADGITRKTRCLGSAVSLPFICFRLQLNAFDEVYTCSVKLNNQIIG